MSFKRLEHLWLQSFQSDWSADDDVHNLFILEPSKEPDLKGSNVVKRITFQEFAPGLEHLDLVNSGIREIDKVQNDMMKLQIQ